MSNRYGEQSFNRKAPHVYEIITNAKPGFGVPLVKRGLQFMFEETDCLIVEAIILASNKHAQVVATHVGFIHQGNNGPNRYYRITISRWLSLNPGSKAEARRPK
ncbi:MAG: hypothetical protein AB7Q00_14450 [Phycisphaerales bacterium]